MNTKIQMQKVNVIGTSGSGKSTFSHKLANILGGEHIELDAICWQNDWQPLDDDAFFSVLETRLEVPVWVVDGNYSRTIPIKWRDVDTVIWLHFPFWLVLYRAVKRAILRVVTREKLWGTNNVETLGQLFSKDSIVWWTISTYKKHERRAYALMANPSYAHIRFIELTSPKQARVFLDEISNLT